jgi:hypothetical protein
MDRLITVKDVKARYGCSTPTARKYIRQCKPHLEDPLVTYEWAFKEWEQSRIVVPKMTKTEQARIERRINEGPTRVPRRW